jgi:thioredoxin reductase
MWDCLVIGGGPAGLTGAIYLSRYRRRALVIDVGRGRAGAIPKRRCEVDELGPALGDVLHDALP